MVKTRPTKSKRPRTAGGKLLGRDQWECSRCKAWNVGAGCEYCPPPVATGAELAGIMQRASRAALPDVDWSDWPATTLSIKDLS